jgi:hypothetical protein
MTRSELAGLVVEHVWLHHGIQAPVDRKYIAKLEAGKIAWPNARYRDALRAVLGVATDEALGFHSTNVVRAAKRLDPIDQRLVSDGVAALGGPETLAPCASLETLSDAFETAFGYERLTEADWKAKADSYGEEYMRIGAAPLQARLTGELLRLQQQLDDNPVLWGVAARLLTVTGKTLPSVAGAAGASHWYRLAARASDRSHDTFTRVWVRGRAALALAYEGAALPTARSLAEQALVLSEKPSLGRLNALLALAHVQGLQGDRDNALFTWNQARALFEHVGSDEQMSDFAIPEWRMGVISSMLLARLGEERLATAMQDTAEKNLPAGLPRFATHLELHRGLMRVKAHDVSGGLHYARSALARLPAERHSLSLRLMLDEIERTALTH